MKLLAAFLKLIRWLNLVFIAITQLLFYYCIIIPILSRANVSVDSFKEYHLALIIFSSVAIAAAGYIINDYFDINIDLINKPQRNVVDKIMNRRWAMFWHMFLSMIGIVTGFYVDYISHHFLLGVSNVICVVLLFVYSLTLKRQLLIGNILISLLTAWVVFVIGIYVLLDFLLIPGAKPDFVSRILRITLLYTAFAFIISLIREVVKDMEDIEGDRKHGCRTMPIVWGINATKIFTAVWLIVITGIIITVQGYVLLFGWWGSTVYVFLLIVFPLVWIFRKLIKAQTASDFNHLSQWIKLVMFTGICSMVFFRLYL
ncbi:MAG TPA: geranylgeranylglycerol-phosphate geranylgeranyltransferase [Chitinophagaceae bacterium]|nr:geranylgeranylglycerol-phosphate geranylgeranyltransferase [Chitinophagaceae bacterium]